MSESVVQDRAGMKRQPGADSEADNPLTPRSLQVRPKRDRPWRYAFLGVLGVLLAALLFTPGLPLQWKMYAVVHGICAQQHNVFLSGMQFPLCARNSGIYISFLLTIGYFWVLGRQRAGRIPPWPITIVLFGFVAIMGVDGFNSLFVDLGMPSFYTPDNRLRTLTGMGMGISIATLLHLIINLTLRKDVDDKQPVLHNWRELGGILLINFLVLAAIYGNLDFMFWPLAFLAFFGIISVLYLVSILLTSLFMGYEGSVTSLPQLARPATIALIPTLFILGILAATRFWLEVQGLVL
ncbi:MAG: DUF2085 domain-containing protein [Chloroflexales bacterium]|nr:DUF2085 domain-containing protein [Chloroflexales bacterium]